MSLKKEFLTGVFYTAVAKYSGIVIGLIVASILARLLTPKEFGVVGVATVLISFFNILGDIGIGPAIIQNKKLSQEDIKSIHSFTTYLGIILALIFFFSSGLIAKFYQDGALIDICKWLSLTIIFTCWSIVPLNLHYKSQKFKKIAFITLGVQILSGAGACVYAYYGGGVFALVLQSIASSLFLSLIYNLNSGLSWKLVPSVEALNKIKSFSSFQFLFNLLSYFARNSDKLLIGRYIGLSQLGYYEKSYRLMMLPLQNITYVISPVLLPIFSNFQDNIIALGQKYLKLLNPLCYLAFPISIILYFCAPELVLIIFGSQWYNSILPLQILSFTVGFQIIISTTGGIFQALGETKRMFLSGCWGALFIVGGFIIAIFGWHTLLAVCIAYVIAQIANVVQCFYSLFSVMGIPPLKFFRNLIKPIGISCIIFIIMWMQERYLPISSEWASLIFKVLLGGILTLVSIHLFSPYDVYKLIVKREIPS